MRSRNIALSIVLLALGASGAIARTEKNSFLNRPVGSAAELVSQMRKDPEVRSRFERHFGKSVDQLAAEFSKLRLSKLSEDGQYWVYNVDDKGVVRAKFLHLKKGTAVFVDGKGRPVLKKSCGNAMKPGSDGQSVALNPVASGEMELRDLSILAEPGPYPLVAQNFEPDAPVIDVTPPPITVPPVEHHEADIPIQGGGSGFSIPGLLVAAGGSFFYSGGGSPHTPVPEPATGLALGLGIGLPMLLRRRRRSRS